MDAALIGLAGVVVGAVLGGTGRYWLLRRDAWSAARRSGLLLLADVRALRAANADARVVSETALGVKTWETHRDTLAGFRQGNFPNGYRAHEWLALAGHFARLREIRAGDQAGWDRAQTELEAAEGLLARFENDPPVLGYVVKGAFRR